MTSDKWKKKDIQSRIERIESAIQIAREYLDTGANADWHGFRAYFNAKTRNGKALPPHEDWVRNVFIPDRIKALHNAENTLEKFD